VIAHRQVMPVAVGTPSSQVMHVIATSTTRGWAVLRLPCGERLCKQTSRKQGAALDMLTSVHQSSVCSSADLDTC